MKNMSIRTRMLVGVVLLNLVGAVLVVVYLHISMAGGLDVWAQKSLDVGRGAWGEVSTIAVDELGNPSVPANAIK
jgi:hypothetical protein